jgi:protein-S-isoprenylcysteine O-methyltransferase Ste14
MLSLRRNIAISALFTLFGGPGLTLVLVPWLITRFRIPNAESAVEIAAGLVLMALGIVPLLESIARFVAVGKGTLVPTAPTQHLVVSGLYRLVRNPMYTGVLTVIAGEALLFQSMNLVLYLGVAWLAMHLFVRLYEEPRLTRTYAEEYRLYKSNVPRWIPRLRPWSGA